MTKDDTIRMAREAGLAAILGEHASEYGNGTFENTPYPELERFANLVAAQEREACAKLIEEYPHWLGTVAKREIAAAIRG